MLSQRGLERLEATTSSSFACDLKKWHGIMQAYEGGGHAYHATMPTDALAQFRDAMLETVNDGLEKTRERQLELGRRVRAMFAERGFTSVAAEGFEAPGVVVLYTQRDDLHRAVASLLRDSRQQPAFHWPVMNRKTTRPSASGSSAWTSCATLTAASIISAKRWTHCCNQAPC